MSQWASYGCIVLRTLHLSSKWSVSRGNVLYRPKAAGEPGCKVVATLTHCGLVDLQKWAILTPYWRHQSHGYLKEIWMPVVNIHWCPRTLKGFNIQLLMLIIKCQMSKVKHLTLFKPKKWKKDGNFTKVAQKNRALLDFFFNQVSRFSLILTKTWFSIERKWF